MVDWESCREVGANVAYYGDDEDLIALRELGEYYQEMENEGYF